LLCRPAGDEIDCQSLAAWPSQSEDPRFAAPVAQLDRLIALETAPSGLAELWEGAGKGG